MANEKRLIQQMAEILIKAFPQGDRNNPCPFVYYETFKDIVWDIADQMVDALEDAPTVDAVEVVHEHCDWCKPGEELCGTCRMFFDYYGDGGSDKCSSESNSKKCAYYEPIGCCPNCGAKMDGERKDNG